MTKKHLLSSIILTIAASASAASQSAYFDIDAAAGKQSSSAPLLDSSAFGVLMQGGGRIGETATGYHQLGMETGMLFGSSSASELGVSAEATLMTVPLLAIYNYNLKIADGAAVYFGPAAGIVFSNVDVEANSYGGSMTDSATATAGAFGAQVGAKLKIADNGYLVIGAEWRKILSADYSFTYAGTVRAESMNLMLAKIGVEFNF